MKKDLLTGNIPKTLAVLALPVMGTSFIQMAYNLVDMIWIGRLGSGAVASVGAAGMFVWLANGLSMIPRIGGQVTVGQHLGAKKMKEASIYASSALQLGVVLGILFGILSIILCPALIGFFNLNSPEVIGGAQIYLLIVCGLVVFNMVSQVIGGILAAMGNTVMTFRVTITGLVINFILDPVLIFGIGPVPAMGVAGAASATVFAQFLVFMLYLKAVWKEPTIFKQLTLIRWNGGNIMGNIVRIGLPAAIQDCIFSTISMIIARMVAGFGDAAVAVQKVGSQIESISWMIAEGFAMAINAFTAQNYGAGMKERVFRGWHTALSMMMAWGIFTSLLLILFPKFFFCIFITEQEVIPMGVDYLRIIGLSELFMCLEGAASGTFQGLGKTIPPAVTGIIFNSLRIPIAFLLSKTSLGLNGIWWALTLSCVCKGSVLPIWLSHILKQYKQAK